MQQKPAPQEAPGFPAGVQVAVHAVPEQVGVAPPQAWQAPLEPQAELWVPLTHWPEVESQQNPSLQVPSVGPPQSREHAPSLQVGVSPLQSRQSPLGERQEHAEPSGVNEASEAPAEASGSAALPSAPQVVHSDEPSKSA